MNGSPTGNPRSVGAREGAPAVPVVLTPRRVTRTVGALAALCVLVLAGAGVFWDFYWSLPGSWEEAPRVKHVLAQFNLATENVAAVWFSSMLLLLVAVASVLCFAADASAERRPQRSGRVLKWGWLVFALVFWTLSLDELGSLHERVAVAMASNNPFEDGALWWAFSLLLPILAVAGFMLAFGWVHVRRVPGAFRLLAVGVGCFLSIPVQEYVEIDVMYRSVGAEWQRPVALLLLEEGAEMFGALSFLAAAALYAAETAGGLPSRSGVVLLPCGTRTVAGAATFVFLMGLAMGGVEVVVAGLAGDSGIPRNWFPSALAALVALLGLQLHDATRRARSSHALLYFALAVVSVVASVYVGGYLYGYTSWGALDRVRWVAEGVGVVAVLGLGGALARRVGSAWARGSVVGWALCLSAAIGLAEFSAVPLLAFAAFALLLPGLVAHVGEVSASREAGRSRPTSASPDWTETADAGGIDGEERPGTSIPPYPTPPFSSAVGP